MMAQPQQPRRFSAEPDTPVVVTLKDYVDVQVGAVDRRVDTAEKRIDSVGEQMTAAAKGVGDELHAFKGEIRSDLREVHRELRSIGEQTAREHGSLNTIAKIAAGVVVFTTWLGGVIALVQHFG